jgi:hypothetical protein
MLNPDGVFRGHFRMDQYGNNLNRYYTNPDPIHHPTIYAAKAVLDHYHNLASLSAYIDCHAHASKRGCFIYGNVLDSIEDQIQNQLYCQLIALNSPHFDYEGCLFSREHMARIDPGDAKKGLTAEGSGRVSTYLRYGLIHSYTIESNYNTSRVGNEVPATEGDPGGAAGDSGSVTFTPNPEKYTSYSWAGVGRAMLVAMLDLRGENPCSRIPNSRHRRLEEMRRKVYEVVKQRKEYRQAAATARRAAGSFTSNNNNNRNSSNNCNNAPETVWRRCISIPGELTTSNTAEKNCGTGGSSRNRTSSSEPATSSSRSNPRRSTNRLSNNRNPTDTSGAPACANLASAFHLRKRATELAAEMNQRAAGPPLPNGGRRARLPDLPNGLDDGLPSVPNTKFIVREPNSSAKVEAMAQAMVGVQIATHQTREERERQISNRNNTVAGAAGSAAAARISSPNVGLSCDSHSSSGSPKPARPLVMSGHKKVTQQIIYTHLIVLITPNNYLL